MDIKIYSTPTCPYCKMAKAYLEAKGLTYQGFDVSTDESSRGEMVKLSGQMGVPVIVVDNKIILGFDKTKLEALLS